MIKSQLQDINVNASGRTVRRKLKDLNFKTCRPARKPKLTPAMKANRLNWAKQWRDKDVDFWRSGVPGLLGQSIREERRHQNVASGEFLFRETIFLLMHFLLPIR
ncbi:hypothetical protein TNCV_4950471 [Trichonephila clavipes]|nr:hypothetical protein TNCV_4950471 [Trichonephila clavipes]